MRGETPLFFAAFRSKDGLLPEFLIRCGGSLAYHDDIKDDLLDLIARDQSLTYLPLLEEKGIDICSKKSDKYGRSILHLAAQSGNVTLLEHLLNRGYVGGADSPLNPDVRDGYDTSSPLHRAAYARALDAVNLLCSRGCEVNIRNINGDTPLMIAVSNNYYDVAHALIKNHGANVNLSNDHGLTPLHLAVSREYVDIARLLCECGASWSSLSGDGFSPKDISRESENDKIRLLAGKYA